MSWHVWFINFRLDCYFHALSSEWSYSERLVNLINSLSLGWSELLQLHLVHELQFLGCFREGLDTASRDLLRDVRNDFEECAAYCILQDALVFGMTVSLHII